MSNRQYQVPNASTPGSGGVGSDTVAGQGNFFVPYGEATLNGALTTVGAALSGSTASTGLYTTTTSATLTPGAYYIAWSADNTTVILQSTTANGTGPGIAYKGVNNYIGASSNSTSGGVMPSGLGTLDGTLYQMPNVMLEP